MTTRCCQINIFDHLIFQVEDGCDVCICIAHVLERACIHTFIAHLLMVCPDMLTTFVLLLLQICMQFYLKNRASWPRSDECVPWEDWIVPVHVVSLANENGTYVLFHSLLPTLKLLFVVKFDIDVLGTRKKFI